jgi:Flp pilus assembly pilin Flp
MIWPFVLRLQENQLSKVRGAVMIVPLRRLWTEDKGQDIAEYAVMLAVILVLVVGTIRLVGSNANNAFSSVASSIQ